jgi:hypothetical protein
MARTRSERLWILIGVACVLVVAVAAWAFVVSPKLGQAKSVRSQTGSAQGQNAALHADLDRLRAAYKHMGQLRAQRDVAREALPTDNAMSAFTNQLAGQAKAAHVSITMLNTSDPAPITSSAPATVAPSTGASSSAAPVAALPTGPTIAQGIYGIPVTLTVTGTAANDLRFLNAIQHRGPRAVLISSVQLGVAAAASTGPSAKGNVSLDVSLQAFVEAIPTAAPTSAPAVAIASPTPTPVAAGD